MGFNKESVYVNLLYMNYRESYIRGYFYFSEREKPFYIPPKQLLFYNTVKDDVLKNPDFLAFASHYRYSACKVLPFCIGI